MGRGKKEQNDSRLIWANIVGTKKDETPEFKLVDAETKKELKSEKAISGYVTFMDIATGVSKFDGLPYESIKMYLNDPDAGETYGLTVSMSSVGRTIVNAMATLEGSIGELEISLGVNKNGYPTVFLNNNGTPLKWGYKYAELMEHAKEIKKQKKVGNRMIEDIQSDNASEFLMNIWKEKIMKLEKEPVPTVGKPTRKNNVPEDFYWDNKGEVDPNEQTKEAVPVPAGGSDDLPF